MTPLEPDDAGTVPSGEVPSSTVPSGEVPSSTVPSGEVPSSTVPSGEGPTVAVLDYGIGNLRSAQKALERLGASAHLTSDPDLIASAAGVVLPGVGAFGACVDALAATGLDRQAKAAVDRGQPFLGICVGMQLMFEKSDECPDSVGLGILPGRVTWLPPTVKRPQMQWNQLTLTRPDPLTEGLDGAWMYFVHSLSADLDPDDEAVIATVDYGGPVVAAVAKDNVWAAQFHPEKSSRAGIALLHNFLTLCRSGKATR